MGSEASDVQEQPRGGPSDPSLALWALKGPFDVSNAQEPDNRAELPASEEQTLRQSPEGIAAGKFDYHTLKVPPKPGLVAKLRMGMMIHGVDLFVWPGGVTSTAHTYGDLNITAAAFRGALRLRKEQGEV